MVTEKSVVECILDQTTILGDLHMPPKLSIMFSALNIAIMDIWQCFIKIILFSIDGRLIRLIDHIKSNKNMRNFNPNIN